MPRPFAARYRPALGASRGGGYVNPPTLAFLRAYLERTGGHPPEAGRTWPWGFASDLLGESFASLADVPDPGPDHQLPPLGRWVPGGPKVEMKSPTRSIGSTSPIPPRKCS